MKHEAEFSRTFAAAHRLHNDPSKCHNIHGHNYRVVAAIRSDESLDAHGFVVPFDKVKEIIDRNDHALILSRDDPLLEVLSGHDLRLRVMEGSPTTERFAKALADDLAELLRSLGLRRADVQVDLRETEGIAARGYASLDN